MGFIYALVFFLISLTSFHNVWIHLKSYIAGKKRDGWEDDGSLDAMIIFVHLLVGVFFFILIFFCFGD